MTDPLLCACNCGVALSGRQKKWATPECQKKEARRAHLWKCFEVTPEDYDTIVAYQGGGCGICGKPPKPGKSLAIDHDHQTGYVRGALCFFCNRRILGARTAEILVKTAAYVTHPPALYALGRNVIAPGRPKKKRTTRKRRR